MSEQALERRLRVGVQIRGGRALKFTSPGTSGVPDRIVLLPGGKTIFVEMKAPGETMEPIQRKRAQQLKDLGFQVYCLDSVAAVDNFLREVFPAYDC